VVTYFAVTSNSRFVCNAVFRVLIVNKVEIILPRFVYINGFTFPKVTCFSLQLYDYYKTTITANFRLNFMFAGYSELSKQFFNGPQLCFFQSTIPQTNFNDRANIYTPY
jgi:hypothetical protein